MRIRHCCWILCCAAACADAVEPARVELPVNAGVAAATSIETDLGYEVRLTEARMVMDDIEFVVAGEAHASLWRRCVDWLIPAAHAHPGHYEGGDVTGELLGHFVIDLIGGNAAPLGMATLIVGAYTSTNFTFGLASASDGLPVGDALIGHTALLRGTASNTESSIEFSVALDAPTGRMLVGAPFEVEVEPSSAFGVDFELLPRDPVEGDTLFDGIDFAALPRSPDGIVEMSAANTDAAMVDAYDGLRRIFLTHDHFRFGAAGASN